MPKLTRSEVLYKFLLQPQRTQIRKPTSHNALRFSTKLVGLEFKGICQKTNNRFSKRISSIASANSQLYIHNKNQKHPPTFHDNKTISTAVKDPGDATIRKKFLNRHQSAWLAVQLSIGIFSLSYKTKSRQRISEM